MKRHFTLIELLVVIAIIAILAAILLPALNSARQRGLAADCISRLKQVGTAIMMYSDASDGFLPGSCDTQGKYWTEILSQTNLLPGDPSTSDPDRKMVYRCPSIPLTSGVAVNWAQRTYGMRINMDKAWKTRKYIPLKRVQSSSQIMYVADSWHLNNRIPALEFDGGLAYYNANYAGHDSSIAAIHANQCNMMFLDGHADALAPEELLAIERKRWRDPDDQHVGNTSKPSTLSCFDMNYNQRKYQ